MKKILCLTAVALLLMAQTVLAAPTEQGILDLLAVVNKPLNGVVSTGLVGGEPLPGLPNFTVGAGAAAFKVDYKDLNTGESKTTYLPTAFATARVGLFGGFSLPAVSGIGSIAIGARVGVIPSGPEETVNVTGGEVRVGLLNDSLNTPGVSVSLTYNAISDAKFGKDTDDAQATIKAHNMGIKAIVQKELLIFTPYVGVGQEKFSTEATYRIDSLGLNKSWDTDTTETRLLAGVEISPFPFFRLGLEYNTVGGDSAYALSLRFKL
jgi:opacity protein-like surface antigen